MTREPNRRVYEFLNTLSAALGKDSEITRFDKTEIYDSVSNILEAYASLVKSIENHFLKSLSSFSETIGTGRVSSFGSLGSVSEALEKKSPLLIGKELDAFIGKFNDDVYKIDRFYSKLSEMFSEVSSVPIYSTPKVDAGEYEEIYRYFSYGSGDYLTEDELFDGIALVIAVTRVFNRDFGYIRRVTGDGKLSDYIFGGKSREVYVMIENLIELFYGKLKRELVGIDDTVKRIKGVIYKLENIFADSEERLDDVYRSFKRMAMIMRRFFGK